MAGPHETSSVSEPLHSHTIAPRTLVHFLKALEEKK
jgi:hypothetical protein